MDVSTRCFFLHHFQKRTFLGTNGSGFYAPGAFLPSNQQNQSIKKNSKQWLKPGKITHWSHPSMIHLQTSTGTGTATSTSAHSVATKKRSSEVCANFRRVCRRPDVRATTRSIRRVHGPHYSDDGYRCRSYTRTRARARSAADQYRPASYQTIHARIDKKPPRRPCTGRHSYGPITIAIRARHATTRYEVFRALAYEIVYEIQW